MQGVFLTQTENSGNLPLPVMVIIAMLCMMLPYLIRIKTGRSITEWLSFTGLRDAVWSRLPFGKKGEKKQAGAKEKGDTRSQAQKIAAKKPEKAASNGLMQFVSDTLTYTRRKKLFVVLPGDVQWDGKTADLTMIVVTKARVIGVLCMASTGKVQCRADRGAWQETRDGKTVSLGPLTGRLQEQDAILRSALRSKGLEQVPCETALVFTSPGVELTGERPVRTFRAEQFFQSLETDADLRSGALVPKEIGTICANMRPKKSKKKA